MRLTNKQIAALALLCLLVVFTLYGKFLSGSDIATQDLNNAFMAPSSSEPLGTDHFGRSNLARLADAIANSLLLAAASVSLAGVFGVVLGVLSGWYGGWVDRVSLVLMNMVMAMPGLVLVLLFAALIPGSVTFLFCGIALTMWADFFRVMRNKSQRLTRADEFENATLLGFGRWYRFRMHVWPYLKRDIFTLACFGAANAVLALAALGFLYVGMRPPHAELGMMMVELFRYYQVAPWVLVQPIVALMLLIFGFYFLSKGREQ
ncbi:MULTISPECIES: ABC transporter permease [unclassified Vibrio]|uniref:ABC transporter permease n=1 Tax=Vibrio sp. HB236076 TaxID=3232307 RepID=A0AB39HK09_9VIBR|nr:ABC transporter permease [Vibrio sp. HB161653]MDP5252865.1 ABC transporter permease [Vibrio sp. HB161653]